MKQKENPPTPTKEKKYHIDIEFDGERLVDDVTILEGWDFPKNKNVMVRSPKLLANISIPRSELKEIEPNSKEGLHTQGEWKVDPILGGTFGYEVVDNNGNTIADCYKNSYYRNRPNGREIGQANAARIVKCVNQHEALVNALKQAIDVIKTWHNADDVWNIYLNNAPEMKPIKQALNNAKNI